MKINSKDYSVPAGKKVNLDRWPTHVKQLYHSKEKYHERLEEQVKDLIELQRLHYASGRYALLII
jgi:hypothetical protein